MHFQAIAAAAVALGLTACQTTTEEEAHIVSHRTSIFDISIKDFIGERGHGKLWTSVHRNRHWLMLDTGTARFEGHLYSLFPGRVYPRRIYQNTFEDDIPGWSYLGSLELTYGKTGNANGALGLMPYMEFTAGPYDCVAFKHAFEKSVFDNPNRPRKILYAYYCSSVEKPNTDQIASNIRLRDVDARDLAINGIRSEAPSRQYLVSGSWIDVSSAIVGKVRFWDDPNRYANDFEAVFSRPSLTCKGDWFRSPDEGAADGMRTGKWTMYCPEDKGIGTVSGVYTWDGKSMGSATGKDEQSRVITLRFR